MSVEATLSRLGLSKNKGAVYLASLEMGGASAQEIAQKIGLPRTTVHEILQHLVGRGLVSFVTKGRARTYTAEQPQKLKALLKEEERNLDAVMPELAALVNTTGIRPKVRFYEGLVGVKTVFEDTLTASSKILLGILSMEDLYQTPGKEYMDDYVERRVKAGIKLRVIRSEQKEVEPTWLFSAKENRELHFAPKDMVFPMTIYLYDNKVGMIGTKKENFGMIIESADLFLTQKNFFEVLWQITRVAKKTD